MQLKRSAEGSAAIDIAVVRRYEGQPSIQFWGERVELRVSTSGLDTDILIQIQLEHYIINIPPTCEGMQLNGVCMCWNSCESSVKTEFKTFFLVYTRGTRTLLFIYLSILCIPKCWLNMKKCDLDKFYTHT